MAHNLHILPSMNANELATTLTARGWQQMRCGDYTLRMRFEVRLSRARRGMATVVAMGGNEKVLMVGTFAQVAAWAQGVA